MKHRHKAIETKTKCFSYCVSSHDCNPMSHGGIVDIETCSCGAMRSTNINGNHFETSGWYTPESEE